MTLPASHLSQRRGFQWYPVQPRDYTVESQPPVQVPSLVILAAARVKGETLGGFIQITERAKPG